MTTRLAVILAALIAALGLIDQLMGWGAGLFLARRFLDLLDWLLFWR